MVLHHKLLYADLADPLALLRDDRRSPTRLSQFWQYAANPQPAATNSDAASPYSALMAASQRMVCERSLAAYDFARHEAVLDVGGGHGVFLTELARAAPFVRLGLFDLPGVVAGAQASLADAGLGKRVSAHTGDFFADPIPTGYDCITLNRILHDHDDAAALELLRNVRSALPAGGALVITEPMAGTKGAEAMGDAYFGLYLWAMRSGRPRRAEEIGAMLQQAGFASWRRRSTSLPIIASMIVAFA